VAAEHGIAVVFLIHSPRGDDEADDRPLLIWAKGAGFYVNAHKTPWKPAFKNVGLYRRRNCLALLSENFPPLDMDRQVESAGTRWAGTQVIGRLTLGE